MHVFYDQWTVHSLLGYTTVNLQVMLATYLQSRFRHMTNYKFLIKIDVQSFLNHLSEMNNTKMLNMPLKGALLILMSHKTQIALGNYFPSC